MPSDKPIFFKQFELMPEDVCALAEAKGIETTDIRFIEKIITGKYNAKVAPLLQAMEIMRSTLKYINSENMNPSGPAYGTMKSAEDALKKCDEILK